MYVRAEARIHGLGVIYLVEVGVLVERHLVLKRLPLRYFHPVLEKYSHGRVDVQRVDHRHPTVSLQDKREDG